jgi:signal peptidase I
MDPVLIALALVLRTFVFQPFSVPSSSMAPTIELGDVVLASKMAYGYSRFSPPQILARAFVLPHGRVAAFSPRRGDVVIFRLPRDETVDYVKRVIGLPGDKVQLARGQLVVNGVVVPREEREPYTMTFAGKTASAARYRESLPGGASHDIVKRDGDEGMLDNTPIFTVPVDQYFVLGDNRDNSLDSRLGPERQGVGFVPRDNLVGRVKWVLFSGAASKNRSNGSRFLMAVH